jgi:hypothetical protein
MKNLSMLHYKKLANFYYIFHRRVLKKDIESLIISKIQNIDSSIDDQSRKEVF